MDGLTALAMLSNRFGVDTGQYALGGPVPDLALLDTYHSFARIMLDNTWREAMTLRDPYETLPRRRAAVGCCSARRSG